MSKTSIWMPLFIGDYLGDTQRLTTEQHGAYLLIIIDYWRAGPPPDDDQILRQITRLDSDGWAKHRPVLARLFQIEGGEWRHKRIDIELEQAAQNKTKLSSRGKAGAAARWGDNGPEIVDEKCLGDATSNATSNAQASPQALLEQCPSPSPSPSPATESKLSVGPKRKSKIPEGFIPVVGPDAVKTAEIMATWNPKQLAYQLEKFIDHHKSRGNLMADWQAAWRTWVKNTVEFSRNRQNGKSESGSNSLLGAIIDAERSSRSGQGQ